MFAPNETQEKTLILNQNCNAAKKSQETHARIIEQNVSEHIPKEVNDMVWIIDDEEEKALVAAVQRLFLPRVETVVRSNQCGLSRNPESLLNQMDIFDVIGSISKRFNCPIRAELILNELLMKMVNLKNFSTNQKTQDRRTFITADNLTNFCSTHRKLLRIACSSFCNLAKNAAR